MEWRPLAARAVVVVWAQRKMASGVRQELAQLMNSSGSHKDLAGKYVISSHLLKFVLTVRLLYEFYYGLVFYMKDNAADEMSTG